MPHKPFEVPLHLPRKVSLSRDGLLRSTLDEKRFKGSFQGLPRLEKSDALPMGSSCGLNKALM